MGKSMENMDTDVWVLRVKVCFETDFFFDMVFSIDELFETVALSLSNQLYLGVYS